MVFRGTLKYSPMDKCVLGFHNGCAPALAGALLCWFLLGVRAISAQSPLISVSQQHHRGKAKKPSERVITSHGAMAPNQIWSWDITWLPAAIKGMDHYW